MNSRKALCVVLLLFVVFVSLSVMPVGKGPFSLVYGPQTAFRSYRASLLLIRAVTAIVVVGNAWVFASFRFRGSTATTNIGLERAPSSSFNSPLRL